MLAEIEKVRGAAQIDANRRKLEMHIYEERATKVEEQGTPGPLADDPAARRTTMW